MTINLHASAVAVAHRGVLILGAPGSGKSSLALMLMAAGARLVADDRCLIRRQDAQLIASAPPELSGLIEARFVGLLNADPLSDVPLALAVDLDQRETDRLPPRRILTLEGISLPLLHRSETTPFSAAILQYLKAGRREP
jgi:HPr kinase/phosphorylase